MEVTITSHKIWGSHVLCPSVLGRTTTWMFHQECLPQPNTTTSAALEAISPHHPAVSPTRSPMEPKWNHNGITIWSLSDKTSTFSSFHLVLNIISLPGYTDICLSILCTCSLVTAMNWKGKVHKVLITSCVLYLDTMASVKNCPLIRTPRLRSP